MTSIFGMLGVDLTAPDHTTLSRRGQHLALARRRARPGTSLHLIVDSTGLSIVGDGEWAAAKHGGRGRRDWRKLHLGVDGSRVIVACALTEPMADDAMTGIRLVLGCESLNESDDRPRPIRQQEATNVAHRERNLLRGVFPGRSARASANASATSATASPAGCVFVTTTGPTIWRTTVNRRSRSSGSRARRASCGSPKGTASRSASSAR